MIRRVLCTSVALLLLASGTSWGAEPGGADRQSLQRDHDRAIELALADPDVQDRVALHGDMKVRAGLFDLSESDRPLEQAMGVGWIVGFYKPGTPIDDPTMTALVDVDTGFVEAGGQALPVMPGSGSNTAEWTGPAWQWIGLSVLFLACVAAAFRRGGGMRMLLPITLAAAAYVVTLADVVPRSMIRGGNIALFAVALVALVAGAIIWMRGPNPTVRFVPRAPWLFWGVVWAVAIVFLVAGSLRVDEPIDVALASDVGARLMAGGVPVYGNIDDVPGKLTNGDTYGPISYLAYLPGVKVSEDRTAVVLWTNVALVLLVGILLFATGFRRGSPSRGAWAAATWTSCPIVAIGAVAGNNDVVVAVMLTFALLLAARPAGRGAMVALAACTKFVPALIVFPLLRMRSETRGNMLEFVGAGIVTTLVVFAIALRGIEAFDAFWDNAIAFQVGRDDISSFWGLTGLSILRYLPLAGAVAVALVSIRRVARDGLSAAASSVAAVLALAIASLPQYWGTYVTWLVPPVLFAMLVAGTDADDDDPAREVSAGRFAEALPSSTGPS